MEPLGFLLGMATFQTAVKHKKTLRKAAVFAASQVLTLTDSLKTAVYGLKEEVEDIVAEAHYENMKKNLLENTEEAGKPVERIAKEAQE